MPRTLPVNVISWNLKGSKGVDVRRGRPPRGDGGRRRGAPGGAGRPGRAIARSLGAKTRHWGFKHWPIRTWPEGMAVIGVTTPAPARTYAITHRRMPWSSRRRIVQVATVRLDADASAGLNVTLVNVHLSSGGDAAHVRARGRGDHPSDRRAGPAGGGRGRRQRSSGGGRASRFRAAGLRDVWSALRGDDPGPTNWRGWVPGTRKPPTQRLDYVLVSQGLDPVAVSVPRSATRTSLRSRASPTTCR